MVIFIPSQLLNNIHEQDALSCFIAPTGCNVYLLDQSSHEVTVSIQMYRMIFVPVWQPWECDGDGGYGSLGDVSLLGDVSEEAVYSVATWQSFLPRFSKLAECLNVKLHLGPVPFVFRKDGRTSRRL